MKAAALLLPHVLLLETHFVMRRTIVSVARDLGVAECQDASTLDRARALLSVKPFDGVVLELDDDTQAIDMLADLRKGLYASAKDVRVIVMASDLRRKDEARLQDLAVDQVLQKPFKIGQLLSALAH